MLQLLLSLALLTGDPAAQPTPLVVRAYDVTSASSWRPAVRNHEQLYPALGEAQEYASEEWKPDATEVIDLVNEVFDEEFQSAGRAIWDDGRGRMVVRAPEPTQQAIVELLARLEAAHARPIEIAIDVVRRPAHAPALASALVASEEAERLLASGGERSSFVMRVPIGELGWLASTSARDALIESEVQIAQGAAVLDPIVTTVDAGLRASARAAVAPGGVWLALSLRDVAAASEPREVRFDAPAFLTTGERGALHHGQRGELDVPALRSHSLVINTLLPEGRTLLAQTTLAGRGGNHAALVALRLVGKAPARHHELVAAQGRRRMTLYDAQLAAPPRARLAFVGAAELDVQRTLQCRVIANAQQMAFAVLESGVADSISGLVPEDQWTSFRGPWLVVRPAADAVAAPEFTTEDVPTLLARLAPSPRVFQVRVELRRAGASVARASLPARLGEESACVLGAEELYVGDFNLEVAQNASAADPVSSRDFEGLILRATPRASSQGELSLDVTAFARVGRQAAEDEAERMATVSRPSARAADELAAAERLSFPKEGARAIVLGDVAERGLSLSVELVEAR